MKVKYVSDEWFQDYKYPSMFICADSCDFKCCTESGSDPSVCQNHALVSKPSYDMPDEELYKRYTFNPITKAVVVGGLEPFLQFAELYGLMTTFYNFGFDGDFVIYTGYDKDEIRPYIKALSIFPNVIVKFGRYVPNLEPHHDDMLGVELASPNQYAERISMTKARLIE